MGFWGIEVKPGEMFTYLDANLKRMIRVTQFQATLGKGTSKKESTLQCTTSRFKDPFFLCTLLPNKVESCPLNLEFGDEDLVTLSVIGSRSIHLSGLRDVHENDSMGKDVGVVSSSENEHGEENSGEAKAKDVERPASLKRKGENADEDGQLQDGKKKKKLNDHGKEEIAHVPKTMLYKKHSGGEEIKTRTNKNDVAHAKDGHDGKVSNDKVLVEKKKKKKKNRKKRVAKRLV